jgi:hypothetical protein
MGACCASKHEAIPEEFIVSIYESLKIRNYSFEKIFEKITNKDCNDKNIQILYSEKMHFSDLKKLLEDCFYDTKSHDYKYFNIHKHIFEDLIKYYTKSNAEISIPEYFSMLLYFVNNSDEEKSKIFYTIHYRKFNEDPKNFRPILMNYLCDILFLLSNIIIEYNNLYETPETLPSHLSSFSVQKVEFFFNKYLHKDITNLQNETNLSLEKIFQILKNISFIFNFNKIREIFLFFFSTQKIHNYSNDEIQQQLKNYFQIKKKNFVL